MPGFLLPLEYDGKKVTEFLLVPWVGACIHTPPPPANQIVHVKLAEGYETEGGLFTPVWVNGVMRTENSSPELSLVDGSANTATGYATYNTVYFEHQRHFTPDPRAHGDLRLGFLWQRYLCGEQTRSPC